MSAIVPQHCFTAPWRLAYLAELGTITRSCGTKATIFCARFLPDSQIREEARLYELERYGLSLEKKSGPTTT